MSMVPPARSMRVGADETIRTRGIIRIAESRIPRSRSDVHRIDAAAARARDDGRRSRPPAASTRGTSTNVSGSRAETPKTSVAMNRASTSDAHRPAAMPSPVTAAACATTGRQNVRGSRTERHADANLAAPCRDQLRQHTVEADRREQERRRREQREQDRVHAAAATAMPTAVRSATGRHRRRASVRSRGAPRGWPSSIRVDPGSSARGNTDPASTGCTRTSRSAAPAPSGRRSRARRRRRRRFSSFDSPAGRARRTRGRSDSRRERTDRRTRA